MWHLKDHHQPAVEPKKEKKGYSVIWIMMEDGRAMMHHSFDTKIDLT